MNSQSYYRDEVRTRRAVAGRNHSAHRRTAAKSGTNLIRWVALGVLLAGFCSSEVVEGATNQIVPVLSLRLTERYDSNVMLQDEGAQAGQESFVTSVLPVLGGNLKGQGETPYSVGLKYAPDFTFFHDLSRESYLRHIGLFDFDVEHKDFKVNANVKAQYTDGTTEPPLWGTTADSDQVPALGATEVRGRRRNMYFASGLVGRQEIGQTFLRGVFDARIWDFMTEDTFVPGAVIQNYYDRSDINGGADFGFKVNPKIEPFLGYRLGHQDQEFRANTPSHSYANLYHRFLVGLTSTPVDWLDLKGEVGPSFHFFDASTLPAGANAEADYLYFLASATFLISSNTTFKVAGGDHLLPASAGNGVFQNLTASGTLAHRFSSKWKGSFTMAYTEYDFDGFTRRDQRFIPEANVEYQINKHFSVGAWYAYTWAENELDIPNGSKRNYTRHLAGIGIKATY